MNKRCDNNAKIQGPQSERARSQKGAVLVEFALVLPVFLLLLFGVITFSIALYNKTVLTMASREGARKGAMYVANRTNTAVKANAITAATDACNNLITFGDAVTPGVSTNADPLGTKVITVTTSYTYTGIYVFSDMAISAQTTMKLE